MRSTSKTACVGLAATAGVLVLSAWAFRWQRRTSGSACMEAQNTRMGLPLPVQRMFWQIQQILLRRRLIEVDLVDPSCGIRLVGGVDISFVKGSETDACAALVVLDSKTQKVVYSSLRRVVLTAPYIPGFLAFREVRFLLDLIDELRKKEPSKVPDCIMVDGNGILHPARFGLACHLGVLAGIPTIGIGKSLHYVDGLTRERTNDLKRACLRAGDAVNLVGDSGAVWGAMLRTTEGVGDTNFKPVIVSVGHGLSLDSALGLVRRCCQHRIPEPVRQADLQSREWLRRHGAARELAIDR